MTEVLRQKRLNILFALVHDFLPWSTPDHKGWSELTFVDGSEGGSPRFVMCCGHCLSTDEAEEWRAEGLLKDGPDDSFGRRTLVAGPLAAQWINRNWPDPEDAERWL